tara:strand:- start:1406 stop:3154 length:1749 start_codon:yes stop_codon:yes gene_type:complete
MKKFLITTADENTWPNQKDNIIFLGEWCKKYSRKEIWSTYNSDTLSYHWFDTDKFDKDFKYLKSLQDRLLIKLSNCLNELHGTNFSNKYWEVLIGEFIILCTQVVYDRWENIKNLPHKDIEFNTVRLLFTPSDIATNDLSELQELSSNNDSWNSIIYSIIIDEFKKNNLLNINQINGEYRFLKSKYFYKSKNFKHLILYHYQKLVGYFFKKNQPLIIDSYLNYFDDISINLNFNRLPLFVNIKKPIKVKEYIPSYRNWKILFDSNNKFEEFLIRIIPLIMPKSYLEGYRDIVSKSNSSNFPQNPKFIFTSNISGDELLKNYIASKIEKDSKLIFGQHGGGYGSRNLFSEESHETSISNRYLSWGWNDNKKNNILPFGIIKRSNLKRNLNANNLTLVLNTNARYSNFLSSHVISSQWLLYFNDQCSFINNLNLKINNKLFIKLYPSDYDWSQFDRFNSLSRSIKFYPKGLKFKKVLQKTRICVSTHNATTFVESILCNIPTVIFWDTNISPIRDSSNKIFRDLETAGIFHRSPESAAKHVNKVWDNLDDWWNSKQVVNSIKNFKKYYCQPYPSNKDLTKALSF